MIHKWEWLANSSKILLVLGGEFLAKVAAS